MTSAELNKMFVKKFPNLQEAYLDEISWQEGDDTGSHTVYGDVFTPYLKDCIFNNQEQEYKAIFDFLEEILGLGDEYADNVVYLSVFESLAYLFKVRDDLVACLGERCKKALSEVA